MRLFHDLRLSYVALFSLLVLASQSVVAGEEQNSQSLDAEVQSLKQDVLALNRDLFVLEEELLFPSSTQVAVFVSLDVGEFFEREFFGSFPENIVRKGCNDAIDRYRANEVP